SEEDVARLLAERLPLYEQLADAVVPTADIGAVARALPAIQALAGMPEGTKLLWASSRSGDYPIVVGRGLLESGWWPLEGRRFCVTDSNVKGYSYRLGGLEEVIEITPGELSKDLETVEQVIRRLAEAGMTREDHVVALGGGVVGDLAGFCAHIYQRGVPVVQVPTTLVAQVDSAYGGKTGVDVEVLKNYVGAYHLPAGVIADTSTLRSLSHRELTAGFTEVIKTALLAGGALWERVRQIERINPEALDDVVLSCARYKCAVVAADERDGGLRHVLNLGHTVGHAIEGATGYDYLHGEAIGLGLLAALRLSDAEELRAEVEAILARHDLPTRLDAKEENVGIWTEAILHTLQHDKKRTAAGVGFVLLSEPGKPRTGQLVDPAKVRAAVEELF
ncbi:MAG TPA: 3-dehydroquinate synthase family protein, partial [Solirubrobacterales bacterium]|nr:3-dehydroquinate synthase family protein [Solirubrobacterales bacterium]